MTAHNLLIRLVSEVFAGNYEGPLYAPHPDLKEKRAELGLPTPESVFDEQKNTPESLSLIHI